MSEAIFQLVYDGEAVRDGEMEVADLAPALLGMGQAVKAAARIADGDDVDVSVRVKAHKEGSFQVWLSLAVEGASEFWRFWKSTDGEAAKSLLEAMGIVATGTGAMGVGLIKFIKWLRGRQPENVQRFDDGSVLVSIDSVTIVVDPTVYQMAFDPGVRAGLEKVVAEPLDKDGIDIVRFGGDAVNEEVSKSERYAFRAPLLAEGDDFVNRHTRPFSIVSLSFKPGQKWKLNDGHGSARSVTVLDEEFIDKVNRSEIRFAKGDLLICDVVERSRRTSNGFKSEYEIMKVIEHRPAPSRPMLDGI